MSSKDAPHIDQNEEKVVELDGYFVKKYNEVHGLRLYGYLVKTILIERAKTIVNKKWSYAPFDPGGTGSKSNEITREVELLGRALIIIEKNRIDVPFDPGGFSLGQNSRSSFFKGGRMMREYQVSTQLCNE
ncbi:hypothetical protein HanHA300_Chr15g0558821 [Helianthus annuus]|nr:hypothetical protein HanHA300_Chr15g0558821 [Helianthus annuus]KAJ0472515.1 hypothetical protein HanHA89_Chr15g0607901 [Helianthus annuus]KAJ0648117.1 hypothetical protein HanLR1_Chr15g0569271 [Helianthus annuus]